MAVSPKRIDELIQKAQDALASGNAFESDRIALKALQMARSIDDFDRVAGCVRPLAAARAKRTELAEQSGEVYVIDEPFDEQAPIDPGCYLIQPRLVGADARRLRLAALEQEVAVAVLCREPLNQLKMTPIVALCPGTTVRTRIDSPKNGDQPEFDWFVWAREELGDHAVDELDPALEPVKRADALIERMTAIPDHQGIMSALIEACEIASEALAAARAAKEEKAAKARK